jgi:hypothetical protein
MPRPQSAVNVSQRWALGRLHRRTVLIRVRAMGFCRAPAPARSANPLRRAHAASFAAQESAPLGRRSVFLLPAPAGSANRLRPAHAASFAAQESAPLGRRSVFLLPAPAGSANRLRPAHAASFAAQESAPLGRRSVFLLPAPTRSANRLRRRIFACSCAMVASKRPPSATPAKLTLMF